jgi:hypothetical protein
MPDTPTGRGRGTGAGRPGRGLTYHLHVWIPPAWRGQIRDLSPVEADAWRRVIAAGLTALGKDPT